MSSPVVVKPVKSVRERKRLSEVSAMLQGPTPGDVALVYGGQQFLLPAQVLAVMRAAAQALDAGETVVIAGQEDTLTSQEAADMLNVSRPHLLKMARQGALSHVMAGTHHRFPLSAVQKFARESQRDRTQALREISPPDGYQDGDF